MIQVLTALGAHSLALLLYPGLLTMSVLGGLLEWLWTRPTIGRRPWRDLVRRRPSPVVTTVAICSMLAAVQLSAPFNPVPTAERSVVLAAVALAFTPWAELALTGDASAQPGALLTVQLCWLLAMLGPAVQPESLPPQVLGNLLVPGLLPLKVASALLYLLCLPVLLRLWPRKPAGDRRGKERVDLARTLCWLSYCGLFTTLFFPPSANDLLGVLRFFGITVLVAAAALAGSVILARRGSFLARGLYSRALPVLAGLVLVMVVFTSLLLR